MLENISYQPTREVKEDKTQIWLEEILSTDTRQFILRTLRKNNSFLSEADAEDIAQQIIFKASEAIKKEQFKGESKLKTWLHTIIKREGFNFLRTRNARPIGTDSISPAEELEDSAALSGEAYMTKRMGAEEIKNLTFCINQLPPKQKQIMELYLEGKKVGEIAVIMNITEGAVKSSAFKARQFLQKSMDNKE